MDLLSWSDTYWKISFAALGVMALLYALRGRYISRNASGQRYRPMNVMSKVSNQNNTDNVKEFQLVGGSSSVQSKAALIQRRHATNGNGFDIESQVDTNRELLSFKKNTDDVLGKSNSTSSFSGTFKSTKDTSNTGKNLNFFDSDAEISRNGVKTITNLSTSVTENHLYNPTNATESKTILEESHPEVASEITPMSVDLISESISIESDDDIFHDAESGDGSSDDENEMEIFEQKEKVDICIDEMKSENPNDVRTMEGLKNESTPSENLQKRQDYPSLPTGSRWGVSHPDIDLTGTYILHTDKEWLNLYDKYLTSLGLSWATRTVASKVIHLTSEEIEQSESGKNLLLRSITPKGTWERTLIASGTTFGSESDDYDATRIEMKTGTGDLSESESWWECDGTAHRSWMWGAPPGDYESLRYLEDDGNVLVCESYFYVRNSSDGSVSKDATGNITWRFKRQ